MEWLTILAIALGSLVVLFPVAFVWYICIGGICAAIKGRTVAKQFEKTPSNLMCSVDTDCPPGYVCLGGHCVSQKA